MAKDEEIVYNDEENNSGRIDGKIEKLRKQLKKCQKEKGEYLSQAQRAGADLINYRRRQEQILEEFRKYGLAGLIRELLPIVDSLEIGAKESQEIELIKKQLESVLKQSGVREIEAVGQEFNPQCHEAVEMAESKKKSGVVIEEIQKGYLLGDKVLRVSKVKVSK